MPDSLPFRSARRNYRPAALTTLLIPLAATLLAAVATSECASAQVGWRDISTPNPTSQGTSTLVGRIFYPSTQAGVNTPMATPPASGYPVVVFLHGYNSLGQGYRDLGDRLAAAGFVAVLNNTARYQSSVQRDDGAAWYPALQIENAVSGSFWAGAFDMSRAALCGHSMGGANTIQVMASNPGYRAAFCLSPYAGSSYAQQYAPQITAPLLFVHGTGDATLNWQTTSQAYFNNATSYTPTKSLVLLGNACKHGNLSHIRPGATNADIEVFELTMRTAIGFLQGHLLSQSQGLEHAIGPALLSEPHLSQLYLEMRAPRAWGTGSARLGGSVSIRLAGEPGAAGMFMSFGTTSMPTAFGSLLLDPGSGELINTLPIAGSSPQVTTFSIPNNVNLIGLRAYFQGLAPTDGFGPRLSNRVGLQISQ